MDINEFLEWLKQAYPPEQADAWLTNYQNGNIPLATDPVFNYWNDNVASPTSRIDLSFIQSFGKPEQELGLVERVGRITSLNVREESLKTMSGPDALWDFILGLQESIGLSDTEADNLYFKYEAVSISNEEQAKEQTLLEEEQAETQVGRERYFESFTKALSDIMNNPLAQQSDFAPLRQLGDLVNDPANAQAVAATLQGINQRIAQRGAAEEQRNRALLAGLKRPARPAAEIPAIPRAGEITEEFISGTGLGEGTKLRSFLESEVRGVVGETAQARQDWWEKINAPEALTFQDELDRVRSEGARWARIAGSASTAPFTSQTAWGAGGLAGIARQALDTSQLELQKLQELGQQGFREREGVPEIFDEPDPLLAALQGVKGKFRQEFFRRPGTGTVSRLQPSVRFG